MGVRRTSPRPLRVQWLQPFWGRCRRVQPLEEGRAGEDTRARQAAGRARCPVLEILSRHQKGKGPYSLPTAPVTDYHRLGDLRQHRSAATELYRSEVWHWLLWTSSEGVPRAAFLPEPPEKNSFPLPFLAFSGS